MMIKKLKTKFYSWFCLRNVKTHGKYIKINNKSIFSNNTYLGNDCHFNGIRISGGGKCSIGNHFHSGKDCLIITQNHNYDGGKALPYDNTYVYKDVIIGENVWIGDRVIILPGSVLEDGCIIQAGSVVSSRIPYCAIAGGAPAKVFKYRNMNHYEYYKEKQR